MGHSIFKAQAIPTYPPGMGFHQPWRGFSTFVLGIVGGWRAQPRHCPCAPRCFPEGGHGHSNPGLGTWDVGHGITKAWAIPTYPPEMGFHQL